MATVQDIQIHSVEKELHWYIESVIIPELPQLIEALEICSNLLLYNTPQSINSPDFKKGPSIKLPLTSNKSEILKGILIRDGPYVNQLSIALNQHNFNKIIHKLTLVKPIIMQQIITTNDAIIDSISVLNQFIDLIRNTKDISHCSHETLIQLFNDILDKISVGKKNLQLPYNPNLVFPNNVTPIDYFTPSLPPNLTIDLYLNQAEICIDLKKLHIVTELPWSEITNGKSYVDKIRDEMKLPSIQTTDASTISSETPSLTHTPILKSEPLKLSELDSRLNNLQKHNFLNNMLTSLNIKQKFEPMDYITKCITYNNMVVMVSTKIDVSSPDPILTSVYSKLDLIEYLLAQFLNNLDTIMT